MKRIGMVLWVGGAALAGYAFFIFDPSTDGSSYGMGRIVNLDLQQRQLMMTIAGCAAFLAGVALHALAASKEPERKPVARRSSTRWIEGGRSAPIGDATITDDELAAQEADAREFMARQRT